ncbi:hypothetical protein HDU86_003434 [Geranomyces michiganensis]|nr:hypothetical protein HDU86_003434 [Geranomyces michiganensis]
MDMPTPTAATASVPALLSPPAPPPPPAATAAAAVAVAAAAARGDNNFATFHGYLATTDDAWILLEACRVGILRKVADRPPTMRVPKTARKLSAAAAAVSAAASDSTSAYSPIRSGTIIVFDCSANIKRERTADSAHKGCITDLLSEENRLIKRTLAATLNGKKFHIVSYYTRADLAAKRLETPSHWAVVNNLRLDKTRWASQAAIAGGWNSKVKRLSTSTSTSAKAIATTAVAARSGSTSKVAPLPPPPFSSSDLVPPVMLTVTSPPPPSPPPATLSPMRRSIASFAGEYSMGSISLPQHSSQHQQQLQRRQYHDAVAAAATAQNSFSNLLPQFMHQPFVTPASSAHDIWHGHGGTILASSSSSPPSSLSISPSSSLMPPQLPYATGGGATSPFSSSSSTCSSSTTTTTSARHRQIFPSPPPSTIYSANNTATTPSSLCASSDDLFFDSYASPLDALVSLQLPTPISGNNDNSAGGQFPGLWPAPQLQQQPQQYYSPHQYQHQHQYVPPESMPMSFATTTTMTTAPQPVQRDLDHEFLMQLFGMDDFAAV